MKILFLIARIVLGLMFFVFGLNGFLNFIPMGPQPPGLAGQFMAALLQSHYFLAVSSCEVVGGALLLVNLYVPLALTILGPVILNIVLYHLLMDRSGSLRAAVVVILWGLLAFRHRQSFGSLFTRRDSL